MAAARSLPAVTATCLATRSRPSAVTSRRAGVTRSVVLAHAWVAGGSPSDSERDISVGGVGSVPASLFRGFTYVALGHLHGQQTIDDYLRYSGSPVPYSFSEAAHHKGSWLVELDASGLARAEHVPAPSPRRLAMLRGMLGELLTSPAFSDHEAGFRLGDADRSGPARRCDGSAPRPVPACPGPRLRAGGRAGDPDGYRARVAGRGDLAVAAGFVEHVRGTPVTDGESGLLTAAFLHGGAPRRGRTTRQGQSRQRAAGTAMSADADGVPGVVVVAG